VVECDGFAILSRNKFIREEQSSLSFCLFVYWHENCNKQKLCQVKLLSIGMKPIDNNGCESSERTDCMR